MFPQNYAVLVVGDPGTGMFEFSCYLAASYLRNEERVVFAEIDSSAERVRKQLRRFGVDLVQYELDGQCVLLEGAEASDRRDLKSLTGRITDGMRNVGGSPVRVILDSLTPLYEHNDSEDICSFFQNLSTDVRKDGNLTCTIHRAIIHRDQVEHVGSIADGIIEMMMDRQYRRFIRITRMKGVEVTPRWVQFNFEKTDDDEGTMLGWGKE